MKASAAWKTLLRSKPLEIKGKQPAKSSIQSARHSVFMSTPISADMSPLQFLS